MSDLLSAGQPIKRIEGMPNDHKKWKSRREMIYVPGRGEVEGWPWREKVRYGVGSGGD